MKPNGMKAKKQRREQAKRLTPEGLPRDGKDWLEADWKSLYMALEQATREIAERHKPKEAK